MEFVVSVTKKVEVVHIRSVWIGYNHLKAATCYSEKSLHEKISHEQQLAFYNYQHTQALVKNLINYCPRSEWIAQPLSKLIDFSPLPEELYNYKKTETLLIILQNLQFVLLCVKRLTLDQTVVMNLSKLILFIDIVHFLYKEKIMLFVDFSCGITF